MELKDALEKRRSIRFYKDQPVDKQTVLEIIATSQQAPSWKNSQTARYYIAYSDEAKKKVMESLPEGNQKKVENAPVLIVDSFKKDRSGFTKEGVAENDAGNGWGYYDNGLAHMCLMLAAVEKGLNTLVMGIRDADILRENFNIPEDELITSVIALGYQDIKPTMPKRKDVEDIVKIL